MTITGGEEGAVDGDGEQELRSLRELLHVEVAPVLARWQRAEALCGRGSAARHRAGGVGREDEAAAAEQLLLARAPGADLGVRGRHGGHAHERRPGNADPRELGRRRPPVTDLPVDQERRREDVAQEPEPGDDRRERVRLGEDVEELHLQHVAWPRALHEDGPGERMDRSGVHAGDAGLGDGGAELAVHAIAGRENHFFALIDGDDRLDIRMEPVVSGRRLVFQVLAPIDLDALHLRLLWSRARRPKR